MSTKKAQEIAKKLAGFRLKEVRPGDLISWWDGGDRMVWWLVTKVNITSNWVSVHGWNLAYSELDPILTGYDDHEVKDLPNGTRWRHYPAEKLG